MIVLQSKEVVRWFFWCKTHNTKYADRGHVQMALIGTTLPSPVSVNNSYTMARPLVVFLVLWVLGSEELKQILC